MRTTSRATAGLLAVGLMALGQPAGAQVQDELRRFLHDEASATLHIRSYFFDRVNAAPPNLVALAGGGWVGLHRNVPAEAGRLRLLRPGPSLRLGALAGPDLHRLSPNHRRARGQSVGHRMLPQTFEAYALRGQLGDVKYFAGYVAAIKPRDDSVFINMGEAAGAPNVNAGMALASLKYSDPDNDDLALRGSAYVVPDILWSSYYDATGAIRLNDDLKVRLSGQLMVQGSNGAHLLTGRPFGTFTAGGGRRDLGADC